MPWEEDTSTFGPMGVRGDEHWIPRFRDFGPYQGDSTGRRIVRGLGPEILDPSSLHFTRKWG